MAHPEQRIFCLAVKEVFPQFFSNVRVLDVGSLDINGNNRFLFDDCGYLGIDIGEGANVDVVCPAHRFFARPFDTIISTEMLEHDKYYGPSLNNMVSLLKPGGLLLFTCATTGREPHGTWSNAPMDSPLTNDYYKNLTEQDIRDVLPVDQVFSIYMFTVDDECHDLRFCGVKKEKI